MLFLTLVGFGMFGASVASGYFYLQLAEQSTGYAWVLALGSVVALLLSGVAMVLAARARNPYVPKEDASLPAANDPQIATIGLQDSLQKQNELVAQWRKTNHMKDTMTMIKISSNAQKQPTAP